MQRLCGVALLQHTLKRIKLQQNMNHQQSAPEHLSPMFRPCGNLRCCGPCCLDRPLVALVCNDGLLLTLAEMSCLMLGIPFVPQFPADPPIRRDAQQRRFGVAVSFGEAELEALLLAATTDTVVKEETNGVGNDTKMGAEHFVDTSVPDHHVAYIITTSGTTGEPKGVVAERGNLRAYIEGFVAKQYFSSAVAAGEVTTSSSGEEDNDSNEGERGLMVTPSSRLLLLSSCTFDPSIADTATCLYVLLPSPHGRLLCASREDIQSSLATVLAAANPTHIVSTPALWQTAAVPTTTANNNSMKSLLSQWTNAPQAVVALGGEPMPPAVISTWASHVKLFNIYGVTEVTVYQTLQRVVGPVAPSVDEEQTETPLLPRSDMKGVCCVAARLPAAGQSPRIDAVWIDGANDSPDEEEGNIVEDDGCASSEGKRGEVVLTGPQVCRGYFIDSVCDKESSNASQAENNSNLSFCVLSIEQLSKMDATHCHHDQQSPERRGLPCTSRAFRTGDVGALEHHRPTSTSITGAAQQRTPSASLRLLGRRDTIVKIHGQRVALAEVENTILSLIGPSSSAAPYITHLVCGLLQFSRPPPSHETTTTTAVDVAETFLSAVVVLRDVHIESSSNTTTQSATAATQQLWGQALSRVAELHLPRHMVPVRWLALPPHSQLPCTSSGKVARKSVLQLLLDQQRNDDGNASSSCPDAAASRQTWFASLSSLGQRIVVEWEALFLTPMKPSSDFFRLGGDSLGALKMTRAVYIAVHHGDASGIDHFGIMPDAFKPQHLVRYPTLAEYIVFVERSCANATFDTAAISSDARNGVGDALAEGFDPNGRDDQGEGAAPEEEEKEPVEGTSLQTHSNDGSVVMDASSSISIGTVDDAVLKRQREGALLLMEAVDAGDAALVSLLVDPAFRIASPNGLATHNKVLLATTPLHMAVASRHLDVVRVLLRSGAKVTAVNQDGVSPAHIAAMHPTSDVFLRILVDHGFPCQARDRRQQSLLHVAARFGSAVCVQYLLTVCHIFPGIRDCWQRTAAHWAVLNGHQAALQILVEPEWRDETKYYVQVRRGGKSTRERSARLAHRRTHLVYETVAEMAVRLFGEGSEMALLAACLTD